MTAINRVARRRSGARTRWLTIALFVLPALALYAVFVLLPVVQAMQYSLYKWNGLTPLTVERPSPRRKPRDAVFWRLRHRARPLFSPVIRSGWQGGVDQARRRRLTPINTPSPARIPPIGKVFPRGEDPGVLQAQPVSEVVVDVGDGFGTSGCFSSGGRASKARATESYCPSDSPLFATWT